MKRILPFGLILCFLALNNSSFAQSLDHVLGEYLIKVNPNHDISRITKDFQVFENTETRFRSQKKLHTPWDIYKVSFDHNAIHEVRFMETLDLHPGVAVIQFNHIAKQRQTIPNDPDFNSQWQWLNDGINGGVADADVDAELAWDYTTGGQTTDGDEIVVAVLDDGTDLNHPDLMGNHWVNTGEIPDDGLDNDNNGYVDDYNGWNIFNDDDDVSGGNHGVNVSGMIGAVGNDGFGAVGINWDVKIMMIKNNFATAEDLVLEAYAYPYTMRQMYNDSDGAEGAFVVATNASWGIDFGDPADAPLWCNFYDDLGAIGVLNCGATSNQTIDIDINGDLPTACPSDFMVAVTRSGSSNDQGGGFGPINIDLGAPGNDVYTTQPGGSHGTTTGTSFSSPLVAGVIALMYSAPCNTLTALSKSDPEAAALAVRGYLLNNVTPVPLFADLVASGGVVNAHLAIEAILNNCGPCPPPSGLEGEMVTDVDAQLTWNNGPNASSADLRWREVGAANWTEVPNATSPYAIADLLACTEYEFQVQNECVDSMATSDYSSIEVFKTDGCCEAPAEITSGDVDNNSAVVNWSSILAAQSYNLQYREVGAANWTTENTTNTTFTLTNLVPCSNYEMQVQTICANEETDFGPLLTIHIFGCGPCEDLPYCENVGDTNFEFIDTVTVNAYTNESGSNDGYAFFPSSSLLLIPGEDNTWSVAMGYAGTVYTETVHGWIDFNQDGEFTEDEVIINEAGQNSVSGIFVVPGDATPGVTRMRIKLSFAPDAIESCNNGFDGETEDYCVEIGFGVCSTPTSVDSLSSNEGGITIAWPGSNIAIAYEVQWKLSSETDWNSEASSTNTLGVFGLAVCTSYDFRVKSVCQNDESDYTAIYTYSTACPTGTNQPEWSKGITAFPNPFDNSLSVSLSLEQAGTFDFQIRDINGKAVKAATSRSLRSGQNQIELADMENLSQGVYYLQISSDDANALVKVIKM